MRATICCFLVWTTYLLLAGAEEVQFPQELIDRLANSEIHSISDLQRLLDIDSVGAGNDVIEEPKRHKQHFIHHKNYSHHHGYYNDLKSSQLHSRRKRSLVEEAVPAVCKTRTVIYEIPGASPLECCKGNRGRQVRPIGKRSFGNVYSAAHTKKAAAGAFCSAQDEDTVKLQHQVSVHKHVNHWTVTTDKGGFEGADHALSRYSEEGIPVNGERTVKRASRCPGQNCKEGIPVPGTKTIVKASPVPGAKL
ncbi:hypothetical protein WMY93_003700 [Mugilogobius chulae]|uniref:Platelet-derived growth factor N-terminal domain-containing protein n=1 Tax=Mugilogobius chulae TaxID=88201 RepID=A0AAW0Q045_9GOBI